MSPFLALTWVLLNLVPMIMGQNPAPPKPKAPNETVNEIGKTCKL